MAGPGRTRGSGQEGSRRPRGPGVACAYRGLCRQLLGWPLLGWGWVPLGSSLEAAATPPGPTAPSVTGQRHAGHGRGQQTPKPTVPDHPFLLQMGKLRQGPAQPISRRAQKAQRFPLVGWPSPARSVSPCFSNEPRMPCRCLYPGTHPCSIRGCSAERRWSRARRREVTGSGGAGGWV